MCGATVVSPVDGVVIDLQRVDQFVEKVNDPWTRGGLYVAILGNDGVRYYMAHFRAIAEGLQVGDQVSAGTPVAELGESGNAGACHVHFGISPPCPALEWWVRRGVIWPYPYLDDWRRGVWTSPAPEIEAWVLNHPEACTSYS